jgi:hypothetical protein
MPANKGEAQNQPRARDIMKTESARAAAAIRKELKANGIQARVTSKTYSMGSSIRVSLINQLPGTIAKIEEFCSQFQYGHFNGMTDGYEYSNSREDIPQAKHVFISNDLSDGLLQEAWEWATARFSCLDGAPQSYADAWNFHTDNGNGQSFLRRQLQEARGGFWTAHKAREAA